MKATKSQVALESQRITLDFRGFNLQHVEDEVITLDVPGARLNAFTDREVLTDAGLSPLEADMLADAFYDQAQARLIANWMAARLRRGS